MLAAYGCGWFESLAACAEQFLEVAEVYLPIPENVESYKEVYSIYKDVYLNTNKLSERLKDHRK